MKVGSLYAGIGGICTGFHNAGFEIAWANEFDPWACNNTKCNNVKPAIINGIK